MPTWSLQGAALRVWNYVIWERNPIVQTLYVGLMIWCKYAFVTEAYPYIPNQYVDEHRKWTTLTLWIVTFGLFIYLCHSDPGVITADNIHQFKKYPPHPVLFPENKFCRTCKTPKIPRSKHCRVCNHCVARFDHHCIWISTCVGVHNYPQFILFLVAQFALCIDVFYVASSVFVVQSLSITEDDDQFRDAIHSVVASNQPLGFVAVASFMVGVVVWFFILVQIKRITLNITAGESFKRDALHAQANPDNASGAKRLFNMLVSTLPSSGQVSRAERKKDLDASWGGLFSPDTILNTEEHFTKHDVDFNPYNLKNFWANVKDAFQGRAKVVPAIKSKQS